MVKSCSYTTEQQQILPLYSNSVHFFYRKGMWPIDSIVNGMGKIVTLKWRWPPNRAIRKWKFYYIWILLVELRMFFLHDLISLKRSFSWNLSIKGVLTLTDTSGIHHVSVLEFLASTFFRSTALWIRWVTSDQIAVVVVKKGNITRCTVTAAKYTRLQVGGFGIWKRNKKKPSLM